MVNLPRVSTTIPTDTWVRADWEDFLIFADDPGLVNGRFYYDEGYMRIEMSPLGSLHGQDNTLVSTLIVLYATVKNIAIKGLTNTSFRKVQTRESQPDIAFYIGENQRFPDRNNSPVNLNETPPPSLIVEISASSLEDDTQRKKRLYQRMGVKEYWVVDVNVGQVLAFTLSANESVPIRVSQVLPGLEIAIVEEALERSQTQDDGAIGRWLLRTFE